MMDWVPIVLMTFKLVVLGIGMFFAVKWHYDQGKRQKVMDKRALLLAGGKVLAIFVLLLVVVGLFTFTLARTFGLDLTIP